MAATFIQVNLQDFERHFSMPHKKHPSQRAFELVQPVGEEAYYLCQLRSSKAGTLYVKVLTTVKTGQSQARDVGRDAIRCYLLWKDTEGWSTCVGKTNRTYRSGGRGATANDVVLRALDKAREVAKSVVRLPNCPICGRPMVERKSKTGPFLGCCGFRNIGCKGSRQIGPS